MENEFLNVLMRFENLLTMAGAWVIVKTAPKFLPKKFAKTALGARFQPLAPLVICSIAVWLPGLQPDDMGIGTRIMLGIVLGWGSGHVNKIWRQSVFGEDSRIKPSGTSEK